MQSPHKHKGSLIICIAVTQGSIPEAFSFTKGYNSKNEKKYSCVMV